jgi:hypothetical protein
MYSIARFRETSAPGAIPTRDLPLRSRIHEPFVFNTYLYEVNPPIAEYSSLRLDPEA